MKLPPGYFRIRALKEGRVYLCGSPRQTEVVLKFTASLAEAESEAARLRAAADDGVVHFLGTHQVNDCYFLEMEFLDWEPLDECYGFALEHRREIAIKILKVVAGLHEKTLVVSGRCFQLFHSDLKPEHILVDPNSLKIKLVDFGGGVTIDHMSHAEILDQSYSLEASIDIHRIGLIFKRLIPERGNDFKDCFSNPNMRPSADTLLERFESKDGSRGSLMLSGAKVLAAVGIALFFLITFLPTFRSSSEPQKAPLLEGLNARQVMLATEDSNGSPLILLPGKEAISGGWKIQDQEDSFFKRIFLVLFD